MANRRRAIMRRRRHKVRDGKGEKRSMRRPCSVVMRLGLICATAGVLALEPSQAQDATRDDSRSRQAIAFRLYRWEENYLWLSRKTEPLTDYERLKYIHLGGAPENYLSIGGEARYRFDGYNPYLFGLTANGKSLGSNQERVLLHGDLHLSEYFRAFVQADAAAEQGRPVQRAYDQSSPDLRQAFVDFILPAGKSTTTMRVGRQNLWLGPTRWMAARDPTNIRRSFDGALLEYRDDTYILRAFAARPVATYPGLFDDTTSTAEFFRGAYLQAKQPAGLPATVDLYLLGREQDSVTYARGTGREDRWTVGGRVAGKFATLDYAVEGANQFGSFGQAGISAWGFYGQVSRGFEGFAIAPRLGIRAHYASGDSNLKDPTFRTFAAPYPAASEVTEMSLLSLSNTMNLQPYVQVYLPNGPMLDVSWNWVSRASLADSVYGPIGTRFTAPGSKAGNVAQIGQLAFTWNLSPFLQLHGVYSHTFAGDYLKAANGRDMDYYRLQIMQRF
jgi:hypothetical protein